MPKYDFYISASQKGVVCQWSSRVRLESSDVVFMESELGNNKYKLKYLIRLKGEII